jgi:UTP--glucose-1-phosphate uridylyltransferase
LRKIRKAVFPVGGLGTRFLPATKTVPKEMLTVVDKPVIQYVVDEAREAGIEHLIFVTGRSKAVIEDYFDAQVELYATLVERGKTAELSYLQEIQPDPGTTSFTRQQEPLGLGHAVWCARDLVGDEPFALLLPDMLMQAMQARKGCLSEMVDLYYETGGNIIAVQECFPEETHKYGIVGKGRSVAHGFEIINMVEKPREGKALSNFYINGRYILQPEIFKILQRQESGFSNEIQLTDAMLQLAGKEPFYGFHFKGKIFDCGSKIGFIKANVAFALSRNDLRDQIYSPLIDLLKEERAL